jgi:hypothetical protein
LLEDDDEDIRITASQIVCDGLKLSCPVVQIKAVSLWWDWVSAHGAVEGGEEWLWDTALDATKASESQRELPQLTLDGEMDALSVKSLSSDKLFLREPPNIFRNSLWDAAFAATALTGVKGDSDGRRKATALLQSITSAVEASSPSPIDEAWAARWSLLQRKTLLERALGQ